MCRSLIAPASAEIIVITLGTVAAVSSSKQCDGAWPPRPADSRARGCVTGLEWLNSVPFIRTIRFCAVRHPVGTFRNPRDLVNENGVYDGASAKLSQLLVWKDIARDDFDPAMRIIRR